MHRQWQTVFMDHFVDIFFLKQRSIRGTKNNFIDRQRFFVRPPQILTHTALQLAVAATLVEQTPSSTISIEFHIYGSLQCNAV